MDNLWLPRMHQFLFTLLTEISSMFPSLFPSHCPVLPGRVQVPPLNLWLHSKFLSFTWWRFSLPLLLQIVHWEPGTTKNAALFENVFYGKQIKLDWIRSNVLVHLLSFFLLIRSFLIYKKNKPLPTSNLQIRHGATGVEKVPGYYA